MQEPVRDAVQKRISQINFVLRYIASLSSLLNSIVLLFKFYFLYNMEARLPRPPRWRRGAQLPQTLQHRVRAERKARQVNGRVRTPLADRGQVVLQIVGKAQVVEAQRVVGFPRTSAKVETDAVHATREKGTRHLRRNGQFRAGFQAVQEKDQWCRSSSSVIILLGAAILVTAVLGIGVELVSIGRRDAFAMVAEGLVVVVVAGRCGC